MVAEAFTYEDIYELLRTEKFATDLEKINVNDLARIKEYLKAKEHLLKQELNSTNIISSQKKAKIQMEIDNAFRALKDLYEIRERKIINRAILGTRMESGLKDTTNMFDTEIKLYEHLLKVLKQTKCAFFDMIEKAEGTVVEIDESDSEDNTEFVQKDDVYKSEKEKPAQVENEESKPSGGESLGEPKDAEEPEEKINFNKVKFLQECPEVFGEDLQQYGPYNPGDEAELPEQLCSILEKQKKVEVQ